MMKRWRIIPAILAATMGIITCASAREASTAPEAPPARWDQETLALFGSLPVQEGGRIKPLSTFAAFKLLKLRGMRSWRGPERPGERKLERLLAGMVHPELGPVEWLMDTLFYPRAAAEYPVFLVPSDELVDAIGVPHQGKRKRDRYSYMELLPGRDKLYELADQYTALPERELTGLQRQLVNLAHNVADYESLLSFLDFARKEYPSRATEGLRLIFTKEDQTNFSDVLRRAPLLATVIRTLNISEGGELSAEKREAELEALRTLLDMVDTYGAAAKGIALLPPISDGRAEEWVAPGDVVAEAFMSEEPPEMHIALIAGLEDLVASVDNRPDFTRHLESFHGAIVRIATNRGEYESIPQEMAFYRYRFIGRSLPLYILCFLLVAVTWLKPNWRRLTRFAPYALMAPTLLLAIGIVMRCLIRNRPPVTTLYETILFTTVVSVALAIAIELMNRRRIAVSVGALLGAAGMFLANRYEVKEGVDTMPSLVAVLDTNFWLSAHVTTIVMGYGAAMFAAAIGHVYIVGKVLRIRNNDDDFYASVYRMTYGVTAFGLLFAVLGTVLGGIWANESWGRFWGWDPKENGALMIVLWMLTMLHARRGGYIKGLGFNIAAVLCGMVVAFSWWGINLLGVGLHSYGFTSGIFRVLLGFYIVEAVVVLLGLFVWLRDNGYLAPVQATEP
ncbi:MAG: cytochrome c biogenesis protein CcsA [Candidatus Hydrogenedentota bacterium]